MKFTELAKTLKERIDPVYYVEGDDAYFRDCAVEAVLRALGITQPAFNDVRTDGESVKADLGGFVSGLYTLPFLDGKRLVRAYEFYPTEKEWEKELKRYIADPCPTTVLLIVNAGKKANAADLKRKGGVTYVDCSRESEEVLGRWLFSMMRKRGLQADTDAVELMVRYCARDAARMRLETEKLCALLGEGGRVTRAAVEEHVSKDVEYKIYELTQAASRGNYSAFYEILSDMMDKGYDENAALAALVSHYRTLFEVSVMPGTNEEAARTLGVKPYAVQRNRETAARLGKTRVKELYTRLYELSSGMKSGIYNKSGALKAAVAKIFFS